MIDTQELSRALSTSNTAAAPEGFDWTPEGEVPTGWPVDICGTFVCGLVPGPAPSSGWVGIGDKGGLAKSDTAPCIEAACAVALVDEATRRTLVTIS